MKRLVEIYKGPLRICSVRLLDWQIIKMAKELSENGLTHKVIYEQ